MTWGIRCDHPKSWEERPTWILHPESMEWIHRATYPFDNEGEAQAFLKKLRSSSKFDFIFTSRRGHGIPIWRA